MGRAAIFEIKHSLSFVREEHADQRALRLVGTCVRGLSFLESLLYMHLDYRLIYSYKGASGGAATNVITEY